MKKVLPKKSVLFKSLVISACLIYLCVPCFQMTGKVILPIFTALICSVFICSLSHLLRDSEASVGLALIILNLFWLIVALIGEYKVQIANGFQSYWIQYFYFDKLLVVGSVWLGCSLFFSFKRIFIKDNKISDFDSFFKYSTYAFTVFYVFILVYSFILIRLNTADYPFRFRPFATIKEYIESYSEIPYEVIMNVLGNLFYFTPLGYIFYMFLSKKHIKTKIFVNLLFPIFAFTLLEFSQFYFQIGYCEFDDMMMNSIGFWLGNLMCHFCDYLTVKITDGKVKRFWN